METKLTLESSDEEIGNASLDDLIGLMVNSVKENKEVSNRILAIILSKTLHVLQTHHGWGKS